MESEIFAVQKNLFNMMMIAARKKHNAAEKWFARREDREPKLLDKVKTTNYLRGIPKYLVRNPQTTM